MPSWIDEDGFDWFGKVNCKRCFEIFESKGCGPPPHQCCDGKWVTSKYVDGEWILVFCEPPEEPVQHNRKMKAKKIER
jgi:hypothetical protein